MDICDYHEASDSKPLPVRRPDLGPVYLLPEQCALVRLQVDYGKDETALVELWRVQRR